MAKENKKNKAKEPFFKNFGNIVFLVITAFMALYVFTKKGEDGKTTAQRVWDYTKRGQLDDVVIDTVGKGIQTVTQGCPKPMDSEVEAFFKDNAGSIPVAKDFDADPGELCGNGKTYFCTSLPPDKPVPLGWNAPPRPGTDPDYEGPAFDAPFKESPHAMPSPRTVLIREPIKDEGDAAFKEAFFKALKLAPGRIGYLGMRDTTPTVGDISNRRLRLDEEGFWDENDEIVGKWLTSLKIDFVLIDRTAYMEKPWMEEKMSSVMLRLRDGVSLRWFHPVVMGSGYILYRVAPPFEIPKHIKRSFSARARAMLTGGVPENLAFDVPISPVGDTEYRALVSLRWRKEAGLKGRKLTKKMAHGASILEAVDNAVKEIKNNWDEIRKKTLEDKNINVTYVPVSIKDAISQMEIEIDVLYDLCVLTDRTLNNLVWYVEMGLEGISVRGDGSFIYLEPSYALHMETTSEVMFLERMIQQNSNKLKEFLREPKQKVNQKRGSVLNENAWVNDKIYEFGRFRTVNWIEKQGGGDIVELYRGVPLKTIWDVNRAFLVRSLELGAEWLMNNQAKDGQYAYKYTPMNVPGKRWLPGGNIVRHALNPYTLLMVNKIKQDQRYVASAKRGIEFTLKFIRKEGDRCVICHRDPPARYYNAKLNAVAVTILSILKLGDVADISEYKDMLKCMAEEMLYMQDKNGHYWQYDVPPDHPYYGAESTIHAGEFIFVLARLSSYYKDKRYKKACDKAIDFYMKQWRKSLSEPTSEGIYDEEHRVNLIGIVPWLVTAMQDLYKNTKDKKYADIAFEAQDWIDNEFFWWLNRSQYPDYAGASFKVHRELPAVNSCQYAEGAAAAYDIAKRTGRDVEKRRQVVVHSMRFCLQLQFDSYDSTFFLPVPEEAMGGYRYTLGHSRLRNDYNYHAMAAIAQSVEYLEPWDYPAERPIRIPLVLNELLGGLPGPDKDVMDKPKLSTKAITASSQNNDVKSVGQGTVK